MINLGHTRLKPFDPFPFNLLTMVVSLEAIFLSTFVLISQNRMGVMADKRADLDLQINLLSEHEITRLLKQMQMNIEFPMSRGFSVLKEGVPAGVKAEPVVLSSPYAWEETKPDDNPQRSSGEKTGQIPLVAASSNSTSTAANKRYDEARIVAFGSADILTDANWGHEANRNLVMNALGWASPAIALMLVAPRAIATALDTKTTPRLNCGNVPARASAASAAAAPKPAAASAQPFSTIQNQEDAPPCSTCGSIMIRSGACYKCVNCGNTSGCA